jgi:hypothetical protein
MEISNTTKWLINSKLNRIRISVKNINLGGCGLFAYHMYDVLKNRGIEPEILLLGSKENPIHIIVKLHDGSYLDSRGIRNSKEELLKEFELFTIGNSGWGLSIISKTELEVMLTNVKWNKSFDYWFTDNNFKPKSNKELLVESIKKEFYGL